MSKSKADQFAALMDQMHVDQNGRDETMTSIHTTVKTIHAWLMENLEHRKSPDLMGLTYGAGGSMVDWVREPFSFKRMATFVYGSMVLARRLYEFLPGVVYVYDLPPSSLVALRIPAEHPPMPDPVHVNYCSARPSYVFRHFLEYGWLPMCTGSGWVSSTPVEFGGPTYEALIPATNGGAIRKIFNRFAHVVSKCVKAEGAADRLWMGVKPEWFAALVRVTTSIDDREYLRDMRDRMGNFDPTHPALIDLHRQMFEMKTEGLSAVQVYARGHELIDDALRLILASRNKPRSVATNTVQPRTGPIANIPVLKPIQLRQTEPQVLDKSSKNEYWDFLDSLDVGMVTIRDNNGGIIGGTSDVIAQIQASRERGESISVEEATRRAVETIKAARDEPTGSNQ